MTLQARRDLPAYHLNHMCCPLTKSLMRDARNTFPVVWSSLKQSKYRSEKDTPPIALAVNLGFQEGKARIQLHGLKTRYCIQCLLS